MDERPPQPAPGDTSEADPALTSPQSQTPKRRVLPPIPEPGPPVLVEPFPGERGPRSSCFAATVSFVVIVAGIVAIILFAASFVSGERQPFAEGEAVTRAFLESAATGDKDGMRDQLDEKARRSMGDDALTDISTYMADHVGPVARLDRTEQELTLGTDRSESIHLAFVIHGSVGTALIDVDLARDDDRLKITRMALR